MLNPSSVSLAILFVFSALDFRAEAQSVYQNTPQEFKNIFGGEISCQGARGPDSSKFLIFPVYLPGSPTIPPSLVAMPHQRTAAAMENTAKNIKHQIAISNSSFWAQALRPMWFESAKGRLVVERKQSNLTLHYSNGTNFSITLVNVASCRGADGWPRVGCQFDALALQSTALNHEYPQDVCKAYAEPNYRSGCQFKCTFTKSGWDSIGAFSTPAHGPKPRGDNYGSMDPSGPGGSNHYLR